jgi:hypothetical protein
MSMSFMMPGDAIERLWDEDTSEQPSVVTMTVYPGRKRESIPPEPAKQQLAYEFPVS